MAKLPWPGRGVIDQRRLWPPPIGDSCPLGIDHETFYDASRKIADCPRGCGVAGEYLDHHCDVPAASVVKHIVDLRDRYHAAIPGIPH